MQHTDLRSSDDFGTHGGLPPALKCLVFVWDELNKDFQGFVSKLLVDKENKDNLLLPKTGSNPNDVNEMEFQKSKLKSKKFIDEGNEAVGGLSDNTIWCELCDTDVNAGSQQNCYQQNAFTQHLKSNHPGCGESAKGKGYNSNGVYCEGWAGQCGEEGVGATSWYLMCEACRDKYMTPNKKSLNVNDSLLVRATVSQEPKLLQPPTAMNTATLSKKSKFSPNMSLEFFETMKDNALFLLDLNSHNGGLLNKSAGNNLMPLKNKVNLRHSSANEFMVQPNIAHRLSAAALEENLKKTPIQKQNSITNYYSKKLAGTAAIAADNTAPELLWTPPESITCLDMLNAKISDSDSCNVFSIDNDKNFYDPMAMPAQHQNAMHEGPSNIENKVHRSFSMIQGWGFYSYNPVEPSQLSHECLAGGNQIYQVNDSKVVMRRKRTCLCDSSK